MLCLSTKVSKMINLLIALPVTGMQLNNPKILLFFGAVLDLNEEENNTPANDGVNTKYSRKFKLLTNNLSVENMKYT